MTTKTLGKNGTGVQAAEGKRSRGYPRKTDVVLQAAERAFLKMGFALTSMDDIAAIAGVSKRTVYSNFGNKEDLFAEVIRRRCADVLPDGATFERARALETAAALNLLGVSFLKSVFSPAQVQLYQTVMAAARRKPEIGKIMYDGPILNSQALFADFLKARAETGEIKVKDPNMAAAQFIGLLKTNLHMKLLFSMTPRVSEAEIRTSVKSSVDLFMKGVLRR